MRSRTPGRFASRIALAALLTLAPGLALAYFAYTVAADRSETLRVHYTATASLIRDRLVAEMAALEASFERIASSPDVGESVPGARRWLATAERDHPWLTMLFIATSEGLATRDHWFGWQAGEAAESPGALVSLLNRAGRAEFVANDLVEALRLYRDAEALPGPAAWRALARARVGRTLLKLGRTDEGVRVYRTLLRESPDIVGPYGLPFGVVARLQIADALEAAGRSADARTTRLELLDWILENPWDLSSGYRFYLDRARRDLPDAPVDLAERAARASERVASVTSMGVAPARSGDLARLLSEPHATRHVRPVTSDGDVLSCRLLRSGTGVPSMLFGFRVGPPLVARGDTKH